MLPLQKDDDDLCGICNKIVNTHDKSIVCDKCDNWIHIKCNKIEVTVKQYEQYQENPELTFKCKNCSKCGVCDKNIAKNINS